MRPLVAWLCASALFSFAPFAAGDDGDRLIVRTESGLSDVTSACAVLGCTVERALDSPSDLVFLVIAAPGVDLEPEDFMGDDDCDDDQGAFPGIVCAEDDVTVGLLPQPAGLDVTTALEAVRARLQDPALVDHFGTTVRRGYAEQPAVDIVDLDDAREGLALTGAGTVAIIDSGVDPDHPVLASVLVPGYDFTRDLPGSASEMADLDQSTVGLLNGVAAVVNHSAAALLDQSTVGILNDPRFTAFGHGTMVAGVVRLAAPGAQLMPLKAFRADGTGFLSDIVRALYYALHRGAQVVNMSFSLPTPSSELARAVALAEARGVVLVASAGNEGQQRLAYPAALPEVMGVASTTDLDARAVFSNFGPDLVWVAAPGEGVITTYPFGTWSAAWGTSFSAPLVSGTASLLLELRSRCAPGQCQAARLEDALAQAEPLTPELGKGRLDVSRALAAWRQMLGLPPDGPQPSIRSTTALKEACEAGGHFIYATTDIRILGGPHENVASGCSILLGPSASFEADQASMRFAGPFGIGASRERTVSFVGSVWEARSLAFHGSDVAAFRSAASRLTATTGDIAISTGREGKIDLQYRPAGSPSGLEAAGSVYISGGEKLLVSLRDTGIEAGRGVWIHPRGDEGVLKAERAELHGGHGPVVVTTPHRKVLIELKATTLATASGNVTVGATGSESVLKAEVARFSSLGGSVDLSAGRNGWVGKVELSDTVVEATGGVAVQASPHERRYGVVKASNSAFSAGSDIVFGSGAFGTTEVKDSGISSGSAARIFTGTSGSCQAPSNQYQAPALEICP